MDKRYIVIWPVVQPQASGEAMADYQTILLKLNNNLQALQQREAKYAGNTPLDLLNQIIDHQQAITLTQQALAGELTEAEWHESLQSLTIDHTLIEGGFFQKILQALSLPSDQQRDLRHRQIMLQRVHDFWVKGVLENSLHNEVLIELGMETKPEAVEYPWDMVIQRPDQPNRTLPPGTKMIDVFDESGGSLLILGEPGSGKTTMLLDLARQLIARAQTDPSQPMPVVLNLSSWAEKRLALEAWLIEEVAAKYNIPKRLGQVWVDNDEMVLLLDGFDEAGQEHRDGCLKAINAFHKDRLASLVVCSRVTDYELMSDRLNLQQAIFIQPLTETQVFTYLSRLGPEESSLKVALRNDINLKELTDSPLMLSIMSLVFFNDADAGGSLRLNTPEAQRRRLFEIYVQRMFMRRRVDVTYPDDRVRHWLSWLARKMVDHSHTVLMIEHLQPGLLPTYGVERWLYTMGYWSLSGIIGGVLIGLSWGLLLGLMLWLDGFGIVRIIGWASFLSLGFGLGLGVIGLTLALRFKLSNKSAEEKIVPVETLRWSWSGVKNELSWVWKRAEADSQQKRGYRRPSVFALGLVIVLSLLSYAMSQTGWWVGTGVGVFLGSLILLTSGLANVKIEQRIIPNQGIWQSGKNARMMGGIAGLSFGLGAGLLTAITSGISYGMTADSLIVGLLGLVVLGGFIGSAAAVIGGFWYGGLAVIQHFVLRFVLARRGDLPWRLVPFLDYTAECSFLRKVGGGYIFIHRYLMEYFASLRFKAEESDVIVEQLLEQKRIRRSKLAIKGLVGILILIGCIAFSVVNNPLAFFYYIQGNIHLDNGEVDEAIQDFTRATKLDRDNANYLNALCWQGSLAGQAPEVINSCDLAVKLAPNDGAIRDSRGLARALTGDYEGAIDDFRFFVIWAEENRDNEGPFISPTASSKREVWIKALEAGQNPFDEQTLKELRTD